MWSPAFSNVHNTEDIAPIPEAVATAASAPSNIAILFSTSELVGLPNLEYIYPGSSRAIFVPLVLQYQI
ncbi:hypothetical protein SDC9_129056 [bioreactor metagenome]|uniref:Uncharacterized protein n=1 Tax=bioreactor metagenome TaxID=1076179 RepID=A0A645CYR8_9ZZZZ